jgi:hypothetical protein
MAIIILGIPLLIFYCETINVFLFEKPRRVEGSRSPACSHRREVDRFLIPAFFWGVMMRKTWFQHDFNCHNKDGFALLLRQKNGDALYGKFWLLQEHFYTMQQGRKLFINSVEMNEHDLMKVIHTNRRTLDKVLETFRECLGIVSERFLKRFGNVIKVTMPNALIYIQNRNQKSDNKNIDIDIKESSIISMAKRGKMIEEKGRTKLFVPKVNYEQNTN